MRVGTGLLASLCLTCVLAVGCDDPSDDGSELETSASVEPYVETKSGPVRLWAHRTADNDAGDGALVTGVLQLDESGCLFLERDGQRFPVIWPHETEVVTQDPPRIELPDGTQVSTGDGLEGGGGYDAVNTFPFDIPQTCLSSSGEIARFNATGSIEVTE